LINNGIRPINLLLDCLNYITLLTNVPSAAYDAAFIESITVECANEGEKIIAFNDKEYQLTKSDIVVKTNGNIICLGGIIGAKDFGVTENTKDV
jgi:phenylalanyl-tRNA synthetase beta chain